MRLLPKSLFGQIVLALVSGLVVAHVVGAWLMLDDRARFGERLRGEYAAQRIAGLITLLDGTAPEERRRVVRALSVPPTRLSLDEPWQAGGDASPDAEAFMRRVLRELERPAQLQVLSIRRAAPRPEARRRASTCSATTSGRRCCSTSTRCTTSPSRCSRRWWSAAPAGS